MEHSLSSASSFGNNRPLYTNEYSMLNGVTMMISGDTSLKQNCLDKSDTSINSESQD